LDGPGVSSEILAHYLCDLEVQAGRWQVPEVQVRLEVVLAVGKAEARSAEYSHPRHSLGTEKREIWAGVGGGGQSNEVNDGRAVVFAQRPKRKLISVLNPFLFAHLLRGFFQNIYKYTLNP